MAPAIPFPVGVPDIFLPEGRAEGAVIGNVGVFLADRNDQVNAADGLNLVRITEVGDIVTGCMKINIVVVVAAKEIAHVIFAAERNHSFKAGGMAQRKIHGMVGAKATAVGDQEVIVILAADQG